MGLYDGLNSLTVEVTQSQLEASGMTLDQAVETLKRKTLNIPERTHVHTEAVYRITYTYAGAMEATIDA